MGPAATTCPNVGEPSVVSIDVKCAMLKTLEAVIRISSPCISFNWIVLETDMLTSMEPGPIIMLRPASPKTPPGVVNAAVLNHC